MAKNRTFYNFACLSFMATAVFARSLQEDSQDVEIEGSVTSGNGRSREPRIFLGTTTTATTTVSTFTICYTTPAGGITMACTGRRKRAIITDPLEELKELMPDLILPSSPSEAQPTQVVDGDANVEASQDLNQLDKLRSEYAARTAAAAGNNNNSNSNNRSPKFLFYFFTSTTTSTSTTTTATTSVTFTDCTPATSIFDLCTAAG